MTQDERLDCMLRYLLSERDETRGLALPADPGEKRRLWRSLVNVRPPELIDGAYLRTEDAYLQEELRRKGVTRLDGLTPVQPGLYLWQGDITSSPASTSGRGTSPPWRRTPSSTRPTAGCWAALCPVTAASTTPSTPMRACSSVWSAPTSCGGRDMRKKLLHTVGPIIYGAVTPRDRALLASCYRSCLDLAALHGCRSVAFCCISTGEFHFPGELAAQIAIQTVRAWQRQNPDRIEVIFNVFKDSDYEIYRRLLR